MQDRPDSFPESLSGGPPYSEVDIVPSVCDSIIIGVQSNLDLSVSA